MGSPLELAVVRVFDSNQMVVGSGFLVSSDYIVTCAHVVAYAINDVSYKQEDKPDQIVIVNFPFFDLTEKFETRVEFWYPIKSDTNEIVQDIAVLKLTHPEKRPKKTKPINLIAIGNQNIENHCFRAYGFPEGMSEGEWAKGKVIGLAARGRIQIEGTTKTGVRLQKGFSGTAIWDQELRGVVGMAVKEDAKRPEAQVAFMTPTNVLLQVGDLAEVCQVNGRVQQVISLLEGYFNDYKQEIFLAYHQCLPKYTIRDRSDYLRSDYLRQMIQFLEANGDDLLEKFLGNLCIAIQNYPNIGSFYTSLTNWLESQGQDVQQLMADLSVTRNRLLQQATESEPCILIKIHGEKGAWFVNAWVIEDRQKYRNNFQGAHRITKNAESGEPIDIEALDTLMNSLYNKAYEKLERLFLNNNPIAYIHCFLPIQLLSSVALDQLTLEKYNYRPTFGYKYKMSLGFSDRLVPTGDERIFLWRKKGELFEKQIEEQLNGIVSVVDNSRLREVYCELENINGASLKVAMNECKPEETMQILMDTGIPLGLWLREKPEDVECCGKRLKDRVCQGRLKELPQKVKDQRIEAWRAECQNHMGNHVSLLWDDPKLVPPDYVRRMPSHD